MFVDDLGTPENKQFKHEALPQIIYLLQVPARNGDTDNVCVCSSSEKDSHTGDRMKDSFLVEYDDYSIFTWDRMIPPSVICTVS